MKVLQVFGSQDNAIHRRHTLQIDIARRDYRKLSVGIGTEARTQHRVDQHVTIASLQRPAFVTDHCQLHGPTSRLRMLRPMIFANSSGLPFSP